MRPGGTSVAAGDAAAAPASEDDNGSTGDAKRDTSKAQRSGLLKDALEVVEEREKDTDFGSSQVFDLKILAMRVHTSLVHQNC